MFLLAISNSQHNTLHRHRAPAATATDWLIPTSPPHAMFVYSSKHCVAAVTTDTQTVQRGCAEAGMACSRVNYP